NAASDLRSRRARHRRKEPSRDARTTRGCHGRASGRSYAFELMRKRRARYTPAMPETERTRARRVLVTGGAGFIGSFLVAPLLARGYAVRVLDNLDAQVHGADAEPTLPRDVDFRRGDVRDRGACAAALDGVDAVVHCAAAVGVAQSLYRVEHYVDVNVRGTAT